MAMAAIALGLMLNGPASATGVTGFHLGDRPAQDVFTNPQTASISGLCEHRGTSVAVYLSLKSLLICSTQFGIASARHRSMVDPIGQR